MTKTIRLEILGLARKMASNHLEGSLDAAGNGLKAYDDLAGQADFELDGLTVVADAEGVSWRGRGIGRTWRNYDDVGEEGVFGRVRVLADNLIAEAKMGETEDAAADLIGETEKMMKLLRRGVRRVVEIMNVAAPIIETLNNHERDFPTGVTVAVKIGDLRALRDVLDKELEEMR